VAEKVGFELVFFIIESVTYREHNAAALVLPMAPVASCPILLHAEIKPMHKGFADLL
jgi:hypothetical protein